MTMAYLDIRDLQRIRSDYDALTNRVVDLEIECRALLPACHALVLACYRLLEADHLDAERQARDDIRTALKALTREPS